MKLTKSKISIEALHISFEDAKSNTPPFFPTVPSEKPLPSSIFFSTLSFASTGTSLADGKVKKSLLQLFSKKKDAITEDIKNIFFKFHKLIYLFLTAKLKKKLIKV